MKKIYYKVSSFFTEKRSTIILLLMVLSILFIPKNTYALDSISYNSSQWQQDFFTKMNTYFNYDNIIYYSPTNSPSNTSKIMFLPLKSTDIICVNDSNKSLMYNGNYVQIFGLTFGELDTMSFSNILKYNTSGAGNYQSGSTRVHTSIDLYTCTSNTLWKSKDLTYTPPSGSNCPTCEECQECEEGGPVEVSNFPFDKTEFYTLLVLIGILIIMLFLKWCFPMKGGKNNK